MNSDTLCAELMEKLSASPYSQDLVISASYEKNAISSPPESLCAVFFPKETVVTLSPDGNGQACEKKVTNVAVRYYYPKFFSSFTVLSRIHEVSEFFLREYDGYMTKYAISPVSFQRDVSLSYIESVLTFSGETCPGLGDGGQVYFPFAEYFCRGHVDDAEKHLTQEEKAFVRQPYETLTYVGDGQSEKTVALPRRPDGLMIFCTGLPPFALDGDRVKIRYGVCFGGRASSGISLTGQTLGVKNLTGNGYEVALNETGRSYCVTMCN